MTLLEQIRYYRAMASHYRALNYQLQAKYRFLYASPLYDNRKGMAHIANEIYLEQWNSVNQSLQELRDTWKRGYAQMERRQLDLIDTEAIRAKYQAYDDQIITY